MQMPKAVAISFHITNVVIIVQTILLAAALWRFW